MYNLFICLGSRFKKVHDFGVVIFEIMGVGSHDVGNYTCLASNKAGKAESSFDLKLSSGKTAAAPHFSKGLKVPTVLICQYFV